MKRVLVGVIGLVVACSTGCVASGDADDEDVGSTSSELRKCADGTTLKGIDVSSWQGSVNWTKVKAAGNVYGFARISDGLAHPDGQFASNWSKMKSAGVIRGAYQYFRPSVSATQQAQMVVDKIKAAGGLKPGDLPPVLDLETAEGLSAASVVSRAKAWINVIESKLRVKPLIYTGANMQAVTGNHFSALHLWVPNYGATCPLMPSGWTNWKFWQTSDTGTVNGVSGRVDTNLFNGTLTALQALTVRASGLAEDEQRDIADEEDEAAGDVPSGETMGSSMRGDDR